MAAKPKAAASPPETVTVPRSVLAQFVSLMESLEAADAIYQVCQATLFRSFAQSAYKAPNAQTALKQAREALETA